MASVLTRFAFWGTLLLIRNDFFPSNLYELVLGFVMVEVLGVALCVEVQVLGVLSTTATVHRFCSSSSDRFTVSAVSAGAVDLDFSL